MSKDEIERIADSMSEEEMRAKTEALEMGRMDVLETAIAALITQVPHPDLIEKAISIRLQELKDAEPDHPSVAWSPPFIHMGAESAAERILRLYRMLSLRQR